MRRRKYPWKQADILQRVPVLRPEAAHCGVFEPDAMDMDVHAIHQGFLRGARAAGGLSWNKT